MEFPADEYAALPLYPGEETLDEPASHIAAQPSSILHRRLDAIGAVWRDHPTPSRRGRKAKPENLIGDRAYDSDPLDEELRTSWWLAACVLTESGSPWRSTIAMIFMPFPRFVVPTSAPPPFAITKVASMKHSSSSSAPLSRSSLATSVSTQRRTSSRHQV